MASTTSAAVQNDGSPQILMNHPVSPQVRDATTSQLASLDSSTQMDDASMTSTNQPVSTHQKSDTVSMQPNITPGPTSVIITDYQLSQILSMVDPSYNMNSNSNFARCTARFDGSKDVYVLAFIEAIEVYKECVAMEENIALRGLPMLLTGLAATWWLRVKQSVLTWTKAMQLLKHTYGARLPPHKIYRVFFIIPHKIYRELFSNEQGDESTDVFVCIARAQLAQLPPGTLAENPVQLGMVYGLLNRKIRKKVIRSSFKTFSELLEKARAVEDLFEEGRMRPYSRQQISSNRSLGVSSSTPNNNKARLNASVATSYSGNN
ncbi:unnamed protein product [Parnassius apollo]|uniref:(apollo) hypothetical protein n=1 Tax=Parnassius apollo TaxID=110799 RepID=A0A8S3XT35_PARAO|nr:unnamed protein product [Parnassius apollo]